MSLRPYRDAYRRSCRQVMVGDVAVGGDAPIAVQSMTTTPTHDVAATVAQVKALEEAGADVLACADIEEGVLLREAGVRISILVFGALSVNSDITEIVEEITFLANNTVDALDFCKEYLHV